MANINLVHLHPSPHRPQPRARRARLALVAFAVLTVGAALTACDDSQPAHHRPRPHGHHAHQEPGPAQTDASKEPHQHAKAKPGHAKKTAAGTALAALAALPVKGRAPMTGYDRDEFGPAWLDANHNGCDTRNDVLRRDLTGRRLDPSTHGCVVLSGHLADPYTRQPIAFVYGVGTLVDIDHVVALGNAWATGAFRWPITGRAALANDPMNLLAVDASANRQKGDADAATWLPSNKTYRCAYVARQVAVKAKYHLWVTAPEKAAIVRVLASCPNQPVPPDSGAPTRVTNNITDPAHPHSSGSTGTHGTSTNPGTSDVYYTNCDAVRAAGKAPLHRGDPGYDSHLDRDGDGIACE